MWSFIWYVKSTYRVKGFTILKIHDWTQFSFLALTAKAHFNYHTGILNVKRLIYALKTVYITFTLLNSDSKRCQKIEWRLVFSLMPTLFLSQIWPEWIFFSNKLIQGVWNYSQFWSFQIFKPWVNPLPRQIHEKFLYKKMKPKCFWSPLQPASQPSLCTKEKFLEVQNCSCRLWVWVSLFPSHVPDMRNYFQSIPYL